MLDVVPWKEAAHPLMRLRRSEEKVNKNNYYYTGPVCGTIERFSPTVEN